ncbi:2,3,4,5-tetrahydropyridine-2,6-dicarboxylate N-succinyltransferase [Hyphococcus sp.]|uniref:2,3,4,5-tetrahydropyridine-2,6-dicarboxylate N-succinyltransferase n=1 Tax=Hyphococcus sp. TaxID=2038636 RepID=UPI002084CA39|nr:MAG: 2,3,4,5-tetrahydropyridine-2,6-dicarboxylate N-succinyltransferase [Marinicaulis sp.]
MTDTTAIASIIDLAWENRNEISTTTAGEIRDAVSEAIAMLDTGAARVAEPHRAGALTEWRVNQWLKKAVLLSFRLNDNRVIDGANGPWWDKVETKFSGWTEADFREGGFRVVPPATVRRGAFIASGAVLMPSYVNIGAHVGEGAMIDTWASVGSCAQVGAHCHISAGTGIGGVLEPLQANPTIIEDNCFIGARSEVVEGVIVREGSVLAMGVYITGSTKIVHRDSGEITYGEVPPFSVVVPGTLPSAKGGPALYCAVIVKQVDEKTRAKTSVNDLLRS